MTGFERVSAALRREPVDRIPTFEWLTSPKVIDALLPGGDYDAFVEAFDIDGVVAEQYFDKTWLSDTTFADEWGCVKRTSSEEHPVPVDGPIHSMKDLDRYCPPDPLKPSRYQYLDQKLARHRDKAVIFHLNDVFSLPSRLMDFTEFMMAIADDPVLIQGLIDMTIEVNLKMAKEALLRGCRIAFTGDDYAYASGSMMSPTTFRELFYPGLKRVMSGYKQLGLTIIKHSDGDIRPLLDMILDTDIDCLDPIDPMGGLDLADMKARYGHKIALKGNVDCAHTLSFGSVEDTIAETKACIKAAGPGYGYILSSSNSIHSAVKPENFKAMLDTVKQFGVYPIEL